MVEVGGQGRLSAEEFTARLRAVGEEGYHDKHPFHLLMHEGKLTKAQLHAWTTRPLSRKRTRRS